MSDQMDSLSKELETLLKKTTEANRIFITEGAKFVKQLNFSKKGGEEIFTRQTDMMKDAFNLFMKLNIQYASNVVDLGVALSKKYNDTEVATNENTEEENTKAPIISEPAFILQTSGIAGDTAGAMFLLDSNKKEILLCNFKQTDYTLQDDNSTKYIFETNFTPQSFELMPGQSQQVAITAKIPTTTKPGIYQTDIVVQGFEHTYFSLFITVA
jgi:acyl-CoA synthetase (AMP-forming)/AMP-acid ligase II